MAYTPIAPNLPNGAVFTADHIAHIENGILNANSDSREYIDGVAVQIQAGQVTDPAFDAAVDRAVADGRLDLMGTGQDLTITEVLEGTYEIADGTGQIYGLTTGMTLPAAAKLDLESTFPTKAVLDATVGGHVNNATSATYTAVKGVSDSSAGAVRTDLTPSNGNRPVGKGELLVNVRDFGAVGDGNTDDTAAIQAAADATTHGAVLFFPAGKYYVTGTVNLTKTCSVQGQAVGAYAGGELRGSVIFNKMGNASPFTSSADGTWFRDLFFISFQDQTVVTGNQCTAITFTDGENTGIERCMFSGWYQWVDFQNCAQFTIRDNHFSLVSRYGIRVRNIAAPDNGDSVVTGNMFVSNEPWNPEALIRQESSGGLRVFGNKFLATTNGAARFLDVAISDGAETSILVVTGNSFEFPRVSAIRVSTQGPLYTGKFSRVNISGNQFSGNRVTGAVIDVDSKGNPLDLAELSIVGNTMWGHQTFPAGGFVRFNGVNVAHVSGNSFRGGPLGVDITSSAYNVQVDESNQFHEVTLPVRGKRVPSKVSRPSNALLEIDAPRPSAPTTAASTTGGTIASGTYTYAVAYRDGSGLVGQIGDTATVSVTGPEGSVALTWRAWPLVSTVARIYRGTGGDLTEYRDVSGTSLTDNGSGWTAGTHPGTSTYPAVRLGAMNGDPIGSGGNPVGWLIGSMWGINTRFPGSDFHVNGSFGLRVDTVSSGTGTYTVTDNAASVFISALTAARPVNIPTAVGKNGRLLTIKDATGQAGNFAVTITPVSGQTIDGATTYPLNTAYGVVRLQSNGANWFVV